MAENGGSRVFSTKNQSLQFGEKIRRIWGLEKKITQMPNLSKSTTTHGHIMLLLFLHPFFFFFLIGNQRTNINEKKNEKYKMFMMMNNRKQMKQTANKGEGNQKVNLRENINSERDEE